MTGWMDNTKIKGKRFALFISATTTTVLVFTLTIPRTDNPTPKPYGNPQKCPVWISKKTLTPLKGTKHLLVSAYMDRRVSGFDLRIIGIFRRDSIQPLHCLFCCRDHVSTTTETIILEHSDNFGFPYVTTDVRCAIPKDCPATHVSLLTDRDSWKHFDQIWLPIRNLHVEETEEPRFNFTVCISNVFGRYNNVLQFAQSLEMYR